MVLFRNTSRLMPIKLSFIIDRQLLGPGRNSKQPMLKAMNAFVSLHSAPAPSTAAGRAPGGPVEKEDAKTRHACGWRYL